MKILIEMKMNRRTILIIGANPIMNSLLLESAKHRLSIDADVIVFDEAKEIGEYLGSCSDFAFHGFDNRCCEDPFMKIKLEELKTALVPKKFLIEDVKSFEPPKNFMFNEPPRMKKNRNRPDKITLARLRKRR